MNLSTAVMLARRALTRVSVPTQTRAASSISLKYANAAFNAVKTKPAELNKLSEDLAAISTAISSTPSLKQFIHNPTISAKDRTKGLQALYAAVESPQAGKKVTVSTATKNLFGVLNENGRLHETFGVIEGFNALMSEHRGEATVVVTSAAPLPRDVQTRLENALKGSQTAQKAKTLKITNKVRFDCNVIFCCSRCPAHIGQPFRSWWTYYRFWRQDGRFKRSLEGEQVEQPLTG